MTRQRRDDSSKTKSKMKNGTQRALARLILVIFHYLLVLWTDIHSNLLTNAERIQMGKRGGRRYGGQNEAINICSNIHRN